MIDLVWTSPISNPTTTNKVDTDIKNSEDSQYFQPPPQKNNATELRDKNTKTTRVHIKVHIFLLQQSPLTTTTSLKIPPSVK